MKTLYKYDNKGNWVPTGDKDIPPDKDGQYTIPPWYTDVPVPQPCWRPVFKDGKWEETATEEEMHAIIPITQPSVEEKLVMMEKDVADLWYSFMMGGMS